ncbi:MAG TPA: DNA-3-methyladenine glycosylase 2 family protein [Leptolyngbyaceae cyanobacterium M33_DOE_097]|uniref:DNA-3-methyladenine glycosylase II n=1 Tax=Oscillatoriales cyanobacterium SpSt-418 TaxID=2282169 RepID=A0A7C3PFM2_9CYAN|nr:DNA-3-methyladenine glycosylase 2 family protein [Leptolyngbyaceae cyanobacterium M33_DOE_097]
MTQSDSPPAFVDSLHLPSPALQAALQQLYEHDPDFLMIEQANGSLSVRRWEPGFASLVRIIAGQQLSASAAQAIFQRLLHQMELTPANVAACSPDDLKQAGFSQAKIRTCQELATAIATGKLNLERFAQLSDSAIVEQLTQIKGIGPWTAEIYMLFCLERFDSFPAADLAIQASYQKLKNLPQRPSRKELLAYCEALRPVRGVAAHLLWHDYRISRNQRIPVCS